MIKRTIKSFHEQQKSESASPDNQGGTILKGLNNIKGEIIQSRKNYAETVSREREGGGRNSSLENSEKPKTADNVKPKNRIVNRIRNEEKRKTMEIQPLF